MIIAWIAIWTVDDPDASAKAGRPIKPATTSAVKLLQADGLVESSSVADWAATADAVVTVDVTGERELASAGGGETGGDLTGREVRLEVVDRWWSFPGARALPQTFEISAWGWFDSGESARQEVGSEAGSRLEVATAI